MEHDAKFERVIACRMMQKESTELAHFFDSITDFSVGVLPILRWRQCFPTETNPTIVNVNNVITRTPY